MAVPAISAVARSGAAARVGAGLERLTRLDFLPRRYPCGEPAIAASKAHGRPAGYMIRQMIGQRTPSRVLLSNRGNKSKLR